MVQGAAVEDLNLDGWTDIVQANGMVGDDYDSLYPYRDDYWYYQAQIAKTGPEIHAYAHNWADIRGRSIYEDERDCIFLDNAGKISWTGPMNSALATKPILWGVCC
ncbi:MAG: hypothetical protein U5L96_06135 [Owenweeksia sp.]|nr:hypothetical protein [Owenweeksia sp.]